MSRPAPLPPRELPPNDSAAVAAARARAVALHQAGRLAEALPLYAQHLARVPGDAGIWTNLGVLLRARGSRDLALRAQERAYALSPLDAGVRNNYANALSDAGEPARALELRRGLMAEIPDDPAHAQMAGRALRTMGRIEEGVRLLRAALDRHPEAAETEIQLALTLLAGGRHAEGFRHFGARWRTGELTRRETALPEWDGGPLEGRSILVLPEQGFGDTLCFVRALPSLRALGPARVGLLAETPLLRLLEGVEGADWVGTEAAEEDWDCWMPLMDLPRVHFEAWGDAAIPPPARLHVPDDARERARRLLAPHRGRLLVGVVWCGSVTYRGNAVRSVPHAALHPLLALRDVQLVSLYKGPELAAFQADGTGALILDAGSTDRDFADCAALMEELDLVVTTDTVTAHLAGSLGVPTWTLLHWDAFWLWGHKGEETPWYPSMRLIRQQTPRDWGPVIAEVGDGLAALAARRREGLG
jgi:Flp pilus assembly protein TadD